MEPGGQRDGEPGPGAARALDVDPDFEPQSRPRSCTWPLPRPEPATLGSEGRPEPGPPLPPLLLLPPPPPPRPPLPEPGGAPGAAGRLGAPVGAAVAATATAAAATAAAVAAAAAAATGPRKGGSRRNAWGNQSYAELISQAIESAPEKRLTLAQIYEWMVRSVPYFKDKGDSNSSAGWKNSIRHNLSLHSKFIKVHNEATGKSSWWMLNPEGGRSGKAPRRRAASMDNSSKLTRGRVKASKKKAAALPEGAEGPAPASPGSYYPKWPGSPSPRSPDDSEVWTAFRPRSSSNASMASARLSPMGTGLGPEPEGGVAEEEVLASLAYPGNVPPTVNEELELLDGLNLTTPRPLLPQGAASGFSGPPAAFTGPLFGPSEGALPPGEGHFSSSQTLEALLTSDSPPSTDILMTQVDPILPQPSTLLLPGGLPASSPLPPGVSLGPKPLESQGPGPLPPALALMAPPVGMESTPAPKAPEPAVPPLSDEATDQDQMPQDLDLDVYIENLECDMDHIISDLVDGGEGLDFNFEPGSGAPSYPNNSQPSTHSWVPS